MKTQLLVLTIFCAACTTPTTATSAAPTKGKPSAPVKVTAQLTSSSAKMTVTFEADATDVDIAVSGIDGLTITGPEVRASKRSFLRGEAHVFDLNFTPGPQRSAIAVSISGTFGGSHRARVASFTIGEGGVPDSAGTVTTTDDGERVRVMPSSNP